MASFDIVSRIDLQEVDNAVNHYQEGNSIALRFSPIEKRRSPSTRRKKKIRVTTEDDMKMRAVQDTLIENLVRRKVDRKCLDAKESHMASRGMIQREIAIKEGS